MSNDAQVLYAWAYAFPRAIYTSTISKSPEKTVELASKQGIDPSAKLVRVVVIDERFWKNYGLAGPNV